MTDRNLAVTARSKFVTIKFHGLIRYSDLILMFFLCGFISTYKQTILSPLWHIISSLCSAPLYAVVFGKVFVLRLAIMGKNNKSLGMEHREIIRKPDEIITFSKIEALCNKGIVPEQGKITVERCLVVEAAAGFNKIPVVVTKTPAA